jgi:hypothetical protein
VSRNGLIKHGEAMPGKDISSRPGGCGHLI